MGTTADEADYEPGKQCNGRDMCHARLEPLDLRTDDGLELSGCWWLNEGHARATVVLVHGFCANQNDAGLRALASALCNAGIHVLTFDARGHGRSGGHSGVGSREHLDVAAATEVAHRRGLPVVLVGISMGAVAVASYLADSSSQCLTQVAGAVLISSPSRWKVRPSPVSLLMAAMTRTQPGRWLAERFLGVRIAASWRTGEAPELALRKVSAAVVVIHGEGDRLISVAHARRLASSAAGPSRLMVVREMGHGIGPGTACEKATLEAVDWVLEHASATAAPPTTTPGR